ncbi:MAG TPA: enolase C-terminal domain-like protein [Polyangiaceae bacterium]
MTRLLEQRVVLPGDDGANDPPRAADSRRVWNERATLLVVVEDDDGLFGLGEAAPLPDYSPDTLDDAWAELAPLVGKGLPALESGASRELLALSESMRSPAARFALESALLDLWSRQRGEPAWTLLGRLLGELTGSTAQADVATGAERAVAALLPADSGHALDYAERAFERGIRCFKAKAGAPRAWSDELATLRALRRRFPDVRLRVDANQALSPAELWQRLPAFRELRLEWLEEPTARFPEGIDWEVGVPLALDESLQRTPPTPDTARRHGVRAYVLKPTTLGGYVRANELAGVAGAAGLDVVLSHAYEGPVGFSAVAALALALGSSRPPDGLDRHAGLADAPSLPAFDGETRHVRAWSEPGFGLALAPLVERRPPAREVRA